MITTIAQKTGGSIRKVCAVLGWEALYDDGPTRNPVNPLSRLEEPG